MMRNRKVWGVLGLLLALVALGLLPSNAIREEAANAQGAQVQVSLRITNTAGPLGGSTYEISVIMFMKSLAPIATQFIVPPASIGPGQTRSFGPFTLAAEPDGLRLQGRRSFPYPPFQEPFSVTIFPLISGVPHQVDSLIVIAHITGGGAPQEPKLPPELVQIIESGKCPCPHAQYCPTEAAYPYYFSWGREKYGLRWWEDPTAGPGAARKHALAWYNEDARWAFQLKEVGLSTDVPPGRGHPSQGMTTFCLPTQAWWGVNPPSDKNDLVLVNYDAPYGGVYYTNPALNRDGNTKHAKVFELTNWFPGGQIVCWEDWWEGGDNDFNDEIDFLQYPLGPCP